MPAAQQIDRQQLQQALIASGCRLSLDDALANPTIARCLRLTAQAMQRHTPDATTAPQSTDSRELAWARRLLSMAGTTDFARLRAGDLDKETS
ncbi:hypothetical protein [Paracandidimonas soli]|uniref:Uncharacterized protein n=1 Tax=Paracandidimonas soli TaxID=1917182 RepID=A0A4R3UQ30_9BURK|nr:hypothetical protein [Paracandidimonas soli]TCU93926.1 hypothetical protein EV686_11094 [Paracandidimonas soli]